MEVRMKRRAVARVLATAAALAVTGVLGVSADAQAANSYWVKTDTVALGSCKPTVKLQPGVYMQACTRLVGTDLYAVKFQNYLVISNTGTAKQYIHVPESQQHADWYLVSGGLHQGSSDTSTGGCYTTPIYAKESLTCMSSTVTYKTGAGALTGTYVDSWAKIHVEVTGKDYGWWFTPTITGAKGASS
jgi:hypothetical protein